MTIIPNIFKIDKEHRLLKSIKKSDDIIKNIIQEAYTKAGWEAEKKLNLKKFSKDNITYYLYLYSTPDKQSEWANFLPEELKDDPDSFNQTKLSLILFIDTEHELYAVVGGNAFKIIVNFIDHQFGLMIYDRIISLESDEATSTKSRGITGQRIGISEQFRDQHKMINYLQFGKIPKELHIKLDERTGNEHFNFLLQKLTDRLNITVGKAFRVNKQVDFETLHKLISELTVIIGLAPKDFLSSYIQIKDSKIIDELQIHLNHKIYNYIAVLEERSTNSTDNFEFDFCNPNNIEAFYEAETYQLKEKKEDKYEIFATLTDKNEIFKTVVLRAYQTHGNNETSILYYLRGVRVNCYQGKKQTTSSGFLFHFNTEFTYNGEAVFLIDTKWYKLKDAFLQSLARETGIILRNSKLPIGILNRTWDVKIDTKNRLVDESEYNLQYDNQTNYFVMDTITADGVEICDIMYLTSTELYLIHVKHSFTARVRELTNQILISARRISEAITANNLIFFGKVYDSLKSKGRNVNNLNKAEFANLFLNRKIIYVFATASQFEDDPLIENNLDRYNSNIARFSLTTCASEIRTDYFDFMVSQILRTK